MQQTFKCWRVYEKGKNQKKLCEIALEPTRRKSLYMRKRGIKENCQIYLKGKKNFHTEKYHKQSTKIVDKLKKTFKTFEKSIFLKSKQHPLRHASALFHRFGSPCFHFCPQVIFNFLFGFFSSPLAVLVACCLASMCPCFCSCCFFPIQLISSLIVLEKMLDTFLIF